MLYFFLFFSFFLLDLMLCIFTCLCVLVSQLCAFYLTLCVSSSFSPLLLILQLKSVVENFHVIQVVLCYLPKLIWKKKKKEKAIISSWVVPLFSSFQFWLWRVTWLRPLLHVYCISEAVWNIIGFKNRFWFHIFLYFVIFHWSGTVTVV